MAVNFQTRERLEFSRIPAAVTTTTFGSLLTKTPILPIATLNNAASFWGAVGVRSAAEQLFPRLSRLPGMSHFFTPEVSPDSYWNTLNDRFIHTMGFNMGVSVPLFSGLSLFNFIPPVNRWLTARGSSLGASESYLGRFLTQGLVGVTRLLREQNSAEIGFLRVAKGWMCSKPLTRFIEVIVGGVVGIASRGRVNAAEEGAVLKSIERVVNTVTLGGRLTRAPEQLLGFFGRVTPSERAKLMGLAVDVLGNAGSGFVEACIFGAPFNLSTLGQSLLINTMGSYANVCISQHQGFSIGQIWGYRTVLGILKGSVYRGVCSTPSVTTGTGFFLQGAFGLWAISFADRLTRPRLL